MPGNMSLYPLTEDEKTNIRLRNAAGEPQKEIAEDYDVPLSRIKWVCAHEETKKRHREIKQRTRALNFVRAGKHGELRLTMAETYKRRTGRDLLADLQQDANQCR